MFHTIRSWVSSPSGLYLPCKIPGFLYTFFTVAVLSLVLATQQARVSLRTQFQWTRPLWTLL